MGTVLRFAADVGLVNFNGLVRAAESASGLVAVVAHAFPYTVAHEPRGFVGNAEHSVKLMGGHALL